MVIPQVRYRQLCYDCQVNQLSPGDCKVTHKSHLFMYTGGVYVIHEFLGV